MTGLICLWYGAIVDIPPGWLLCDGTAGTPNLLNRFLAPTNIEGAIGQTFGEPDHTHTFNGLPHRHVISGPTPMTGFAAGFSISTSQDGFSGVTDIESKLPPYHALAWIMKD